MHVDGSASISRGALARELHAVDKLGAFFDIIHQDPVLSQVKLIAEPWISGKVGYQVGNFSTKWTEWNGKYAMPCDGSGAATAPASPSWQPGSPAAADLYDRAADVRTRASTSPPLTTGFTLADLVSYNTKHNDANGEGNSDGEKPQSQLELRRGRTTADRRILELRDRSAGTSWLR